MSSTNTSSTPMRLGDPSFASCDAKTFTGDATAMTVTHPATHKVLTIETSVGRMPVVLASMDIFINFTIVSGATAPGYIRLASWDGTTATQEAAGLFQFVSSGASASDHDGGITVVTTSGLKYKRVDTGGCINPMWFGAYGDGTSHPASSVFSSLAACQVHFPRAYSLNQEMDFLVIDKIGSTMSGCIRSPKKTYFFKNANTASDGYPVTFIDCRIWGDFGQSTFDFSKMAASTAKNNGANAAILYTRDGQTSHYPLGSSLGNFLLAGPGYTVANTIGILYNSTSNTDGTVQNLDHVKVSGFYYGIQCGNGAYLMHFEDVDIETCTICMYFPKGLTNAGENIRFYGGGMSNSKICLSNPGAAEFTFFGSLMDYSNQLVVQNYGRVEYHGCHTELEPAGAGLPIFECFSVGGIYYYGGYFFGAGGGPKSAQAPVSLQNNGAVFGMIGTQLYNFTSKTNDVLTGSGRLYFDRCKTIGNPLVGMARNALSDALGGSGTFEIVDSPSNSQSKTGIMGGVYSAGSVTQSDAWTTTGAYAAISTDHAMSGTKSLHCHASGAGNDSFEFFIPVRPGAGGIGTVSFLSPKSYGAAGKNLTIWVRWYRVHVIGSDKYGRPITAGRAEFCGEDDWHFDQAGSTTWTTKNFNPSYNGSAWTKNDPTSLCGLSGDESSTHLLMILTTGGVGSNAVDFYLDELWFTSF